MDSLDDFLKTLKVDLEADDDQNKPTSKEDSVASRQRLETFTDSIIRDDVVAPNIVHFTSRSSVRNQNRRMIMVVIVLILSVSGLRRFSKAYVPFFMKATTEVENKQAVGDGHHENR